jgi:3D (Asp-Asp-Asp) domain-containing protein
MIKHLLLSVSLIAVSFLVGCAETPQAIVSRPLGHRIAQVRTTAYSHTEKGGKHNAVGTYLSGRQVMSAASDWSRFPLGTRFRLVSTNEEYIIDDYGTALIGTNTIDLYKPSRLDMKRWGVRHVDIDVLQWGSKEESLKVLAPRAKHQSVRRMIVALQKKTSARPTGSAID